MTVTKSALDQAIEKRRNQERARKIEEAKKRIVRGFASFFIPVTVAVIMAAVLGIFFHVNHGATFKANVWFWFCKCFFPCLPFQVYFIVK